jgi:hypothetical protein
VVALFLLPSAIPAEDSSNPSQISTFAFSQFFFDNFPGAYFYSSFFENYAPDATFLIEESNGFSLIDSPRVYFEGDPYSHFNWFFNGHNIDSSLRQGAPAFCLPFSSVSQYKLMGESPLTKNYGLGVISSFPRKTATKLTVANVWPNLGSTPLYDDKSDRDQLLYPERRKIITSSYADLSIGQKFNTSALSFALTYFAIKRQFNDFSSFDETFKENGKFLLMHANYHAEIEKGIIAVDVVFNSLSRDNDYAELGRYPQETFERNSETFFSGFHLQKSWFDFRFSFAHENDDMTPSQFNFGKDLKDNDGDGFFPFEKWGSFSSDVFSIALNSSPFSVRTSGLSFFADLKHARLKGNEDSFDFNPISFDQTPYLVVLWNHGEEYSNTNVLAKAGAIFQTPLFKNTTLYAKFLTQYSSLKFQDVENDLSMLSLGYDIGILYDNNRTEILVAFEGMPYEINEDVNFFLEKQRPWGNIHFWNDVNADLHYQTGEEEHVFSCTGGRYHSLESDLAMPFKRRFLLNFTTRFSQSFALNIKGLFKKISNNFWVKFKEESGFYESVEGNDLYFFSEPPEGYILSNHSFKKDPFYAQFLMRIYRRKMDKWIFSFSFMAHIGMGYTAFGNGPAANDVGILDESQANPNSWINGYGRVDGDRAYVGKLFFGFYLAKNLFLSASLKYRDGTPFAFFDSYFDHNQWVFYLKTIQAENWKGEKGGPREDFVSDMSVKLRYKFWVDGCEIHLFAALFNLLDFGSELSEYVFSGGLRYANELQIPRSFRAGISIKL